MSEETKHNIDVLCPECEHKNKINLSSDIKCKECDKTLLGHTYKRFILPLIVTVGLSAVAGAMIDDTVNINRASVKTEYKMMKTCINRFGSRDNCACAVESMSGIVDAQKARLYGENWLRDVLRDRYNDCRD